MRKLLLSVLVICLLLCILHFPKRWRNKSAENIKEFFMESINYIESLLTNNDHPPIPQTNLCICGSLQFYPLLQHLIFRSKTPTKSRTINKSTKTTQRSKKGPSKARVVWVDNAVPQDPQHESNSDAVTNSTEFESSNYHTPSRCPFSHFVQWFFEFIALSVFFFVIQILSLMYNNMTLYKPGAESYAITELVSVFSKNQIPQMT